MKAKVSNKVLLPLVGLVWIVVLIRIFGRPQEEALPTPILTSAAPIAEEIPHQDSLRLSLNYADPFLGTISAFSHAKPATPVSMAYSQSESAAKGLAEHQQEAAALAWRIQFQGLAYVEGRQWALVRVNGRTRYLAPGDSIDRFVLKTIQADSLQLAEGTHIHNIRLGAAPFTAPEVALTDPKP